MVELTLVGAQYASKLAILNQALIIEEGGDTDLSFDGLTQRMRHWLTGDYQAVVAQMGEQLVGYCLFIVETNRVYVRQLYVVENQRRAGHGRALLDWVEANTPEQLPLHLKVLVGNDRVLGFYHKLGYHTHAHELRKRT